jgi:hypothetical protein
MTADHSCKSSGFRIEVKIVDIVNQINQEAAEFCCFCRRKLPGPGLNVNISADRGNWSNLFQLWDDLRRADVTRVNDVIRSTKQLNGLRSQQAMRVGNHANNHKPASIRERGSM